MARGLSKRVESDEGCGIASVLDGLNDATELLELAESEQDEETALAVVADLDKHQAHVEKLEFQRMFSGEMDNAAAFVDIQAGAGGTEAQDWAEILLRMYLRWCESRGWKTELMEVSGGDVAGIKSATLRVEGDYAYGWPKTETGVHRLVLAHVAHQSAAHELFRGLYRVGGSALAQVVADLPQPQSIGVEIATDAAHAHLVAAGDVGGRRVRPVGEDLDTRERAQGLGRFLDRERTLGLDQDRRRVPDRDRYAHAGHADLERRQLEDLAALVQQLDLLRGVAVVGQRLADGDDVVGDLRRERRRRRQRLTRAARRLLRFELLQTGEPRSADRLEGRHHRALETGAAA